MIPFDAPLLDALSAQARSNPRLRQAMDLRNSPADQSRRMLNALEPGTLVPPHCHPESSETIVLLRGRIRQNFYAPDGSLAESVLCEAGGPVPGVSVPAGVLHNTQSLAPGTVIFSALDGPFLPPPP